MISSTEATAVADTVRAIYVAAATDDLTLFRSFIGPKFFTFDDAERFDGDALMRMVMSKYADGIKIKWNVAELDAHVDGDNAWVANANVGSIQSKDADVVPATWLESVCLERQNSSWKFVFLNSSRVST